MKGAITIYEDKGDGVRFTPTQPDSMKIEKLMLDELNKDAAK